MVIVFLNSCLCRGCLYGAVLHLVFTIISTNSPKLGKTVNCRSRGFSRSERQQCRRLLFDWITSNWIIESKEQAHE